MSSLAQEESRSISENVTWGWRKRISDGKVSVGYSHFLGYEKGSGDQADQMRIVEEEAKIVREIYGLFLDGQTPSSIAAILTRRGVPTPAGKVNWSPSTVRSILTNEKYKGDALLQKSFKPDFLSKTQVNRGEVPQFYVENSHPAIVTPEVFDLVQYEMSRRIVKGKHTSAVSIFSNSLVCGECGAFFGSKVWHSNDPYRCVIWRCNRKYEKGTHRCKTPHVREEEIKDAFQIALEQMLEKRQEIIAAYERIIADLTSTDRLTREAERIQAELDGLYLQINQMVRRNAETAQDQDEYNRAFDAMTARCEALKERQQKVNDQLAEKAGRKRKLEAFIERLKETDGLAAFDEHVFAGAVEQVIVHSGETKKEKRLIFCFKDGTEITV